jgi:hypothetical protein
MDIREKVCAEFGVKVEDIFKRGKPSRLRRQIEARIAELSTSADTKTVNVQETEQPVEVAPPPALPRSKPPPTPKTPEEIAAAKARIDEIVGRGRPLHNVDWSTAEKWTDSMVPAFLRK